jgi:hypothetical protein
MVGRICEELDQAGPEGREPMVIVGTTEVVPCYSLPLTESLEYSPIESFE